MKNLVERPTCYGQKGRALTWFYRYISAYNMAAIIDGEEVTEEENEKAFNLLKKCTNYALASAHQWERSNTSERYANSEQCQKDKKRLDKKRSELNEQLNRYGLTLNNFGLYPTICDCETLQPTRHNIGLYFFS